MNDMETKKLAVVAFQLNGSQRDIFDSALALAKHENYKLLFLHVVEYNEDFAYLNHLTEFKDYKKALHNFEKDHLKDIHEEFERLKNEIPSEIDAKFQIRFGAAHTNIIAEAEKEKASMILASIVKKPDFFNRFSLSIHQLMKKSPVPVLIINGQNKLQPLGSKKFKLLVCDDLREENLPMVEKAYKFAKGMKQAHLIHLHIRKGPYNFSEPVRLYEWSSVNIKDAIENKASLSFDLLNRIPQPLIESTDSHVYEFQESAGPIHDTLSYACNVNQPDVILFGKHHEWDLYHPLNWGDMSYKKMLQENAPVMVMK